MRALAPGIALAGVAAGTIARAAPVAFLKVFFLAFVCYVTLQMLFGLKPTRVRPMPGTAGLVGAGALIGGMSGLVGVGGAMISVPFMTMWGVPFHVAIGTSAAISFVVAVAGTAGYVAAGLTAPALPEWSVGYVYLPPSWASRSRASSSHPWARGSRTGCRWAT